MLDVRGVFMTMLATAKGAAKTTTVYVVAGYHPEAVLGDEDATALGIICFNSQGRDPTQEELASNPQSWNIRKVSIAPISEIQPQVG